LFTNGTKEWMNVTWLFHRYKLLLFIYFLCDHKEVQNVTENQNKHVHMVLVSALIYFDQLETCVFNSVQNRWITFLVRRNLRKVG